MAVCTGRLFYICQVTGIDVLSQSCSSFRNRKLQRAVRGRSLPVVQELDGSYNGEVRTGRTLIQDSIGQLIWAFIRTEEDLEPAARAAREGRIGGIWLPPVLMRSAAEAVRLVNWLQASSTVPLLVGVDAEAGLGSVMGGATHLPTAMALGAAGDPELTRRAGRVTASEVSACGINAIGAPDIDVNVNPGNPIINTRAFGGSPQLVSRLGRAFLEGVEIPAGGRVLPIGKHFPGHGDTNLDSHLQLQTLDQPRRRLEEVELAPFREAIAADIPMLMTAHVAYPALDPDPVVPATLSRPILTDLLRVQLGFRGAVVTDAMNMYSIAHNFGPGEAAVRAVGAGCDLVLTDDWTVSYDAVVRALGEKQLSEDRVQEALERVRRVKESIFGPGMAHREAIGPEAAQMAVGTPEHAEVAERIAAASITLVDGALAPPTLHPLVMATRMPRRYGPGVEVQLRSTLSALGWKDAEVMMLDPSPGGEEIELARSRGAAAGWAALLHFNHVKSFDPQALLVSDELATLTGRVTATGVPTTAVSLGSPYVLPLFEATAKLCSYSTCDASLRAVLNVLMGVARAPGRLPCDLEPGVSAATFT